MPIENASYEPQNFHDFHVPLTVLPFKVFFYNETIDQVLEAVHVHYHRNKIPVRSCSLCSFVHVILNNTLHLVYTHPNKIEIVSI